MKASPCGAGQLLRRPVNRKADRWENVRDVFIIKGAQR